MDYRQHPSEEWLDYFRAAGYASVEPIGGGVEGAVYRIRPGRIAKVWAKRPVEELQMFANFYLELRRRDLPFETPLIEGISLVRGRVVTQERELAGHPLEEDLNAGEIVSDRTAEIFAFILAALRDIPWFDAALSLPVLDERSPLLGGSASWPRAVSALIDRKFRQYQSLLARDVVDVDELAAQLQSRVGTFSVPPRGIIHGDLFGGNVLVDEHQQVTGVLDFGFMTCAGDPDFDAAVVALIASQYGPRALETEAKMDLLLTKCLGTDRAKVLTYKAVYALVTSGLFSEDGSDGHYPWCVDILNRSDVREAVRAS